MSGLASALQKDGRSEIVGALQAVIAVDREVAQIRSEWFEYRFVVLALVAGCQHHGVVMGGAAAVSVPVVQ